MLLHVQKYLIFMEEVINHEEENRVRDSKKVIEDENRIGIERLVERLLNFK